MARPWTWILVGVLVAALVLGAAAYPARYLILSRLHVSAGSDAGALGLRLVADVPLEGGASRFDYQSLDAERGLLFIAHLGADQVVAFDVKQQKVAGYVHDISSPHGLVVVPEAHRVFVSATGTHQLAVVDEDGLRVAANASAGDFPDGVAYDAGSVRVFVSDESGGGVTVVDARANEQVGRIDLGGEAGNVQADARAGDIVAAAQGRDALVLIDPTAMGVTTSIALPGCDGPHGFVLDAPARRAFVSCEQNAKLVVVDLDAKREVGGPFAVGDVPDVLALDTGLHRLYVASESGVVATFDERGDGSLAPRASAYLAPAAHSVAVDPATHRVYVPLEDVGGKPVLRILEPIS